MYCLRKKSVAMITLTLLSITAYCDDYLQQIYARELIHRPLTTEQLTAIEEQQVSPHQAAEWLLQAGNFTTHSATFAPYLHQLYYRLGRLTSDRNTDWDPVIINCCAALERYLALFQMLEKYPDHAGELLLPTLPENAPLPLTDRAPYPSELVWHPRWQAVAGKRFSAIFIALPRRALPAVKLTAQPLQLADKTIEVDLMSVNYIPQKTAPLIRKATVSDLTGGMQICQLVIDIPANATQGVYHGRVIAKRNSDGTLLQELFYQLEITQPLPSRNGD